MGIPRCFTTPEGGAGMGGGGGRKAPRVSTLGSSNLTMTTILSDTFLLDLTILNKGTADCECSK